MKLSEIVAIYNGSDGDATRFLYSLLAKEGPRGIVAMNLFRASKNSLRAKMYRGGDGHRSYRSMAYDRKHESMMQLCIALVDRAPALGIRFGWARDPETKNFEHVLYVDLPTGQVSFHSSSRGAGPDYPDKWDGVRNLAPTRICAFCALALGTALDSKMLAGLAAPAPPAELMPRRQENLL